MCCKHFLVFFILACISMSFVFYLYSRLITVGPVLSVFPANDTPPNEQFVVITFYTQQEKYLKKFERLHGSCQKLNLSCIPTVLNLTEFSGPTKHILLALKPRFIINQIKQHQKGVLFVDTDMVLRDFQIWSLLRKIKTKTCA